MDICKHKNKLNADGNRNYLSCMVLLNMESRLKWWLEIFNQKTYWLEIQVWWSL